MSEPLKKAPWNIENGSAEPRALTEALNAAIDHINEKDGELEAYRVILKVYTKALDELEAKYEGHRHACYTNKDTAGDGIIGNTSKPIVDTPPEEASPQPQDTQLQQEAANEEASI